MEECEDRADVGSMLATETPRELRRLSISQSDGCFFKFLNKDRQMSPSFCDIAITVHGKTYHAHKVVLAFGSSYFHAKLSENPDLDRVTFDNVESFTFGQLLDFLYTSEIEVEESQIPPLAEAACFFDMMEAVNLLAGEVEPAPGQVAEDEGEEEEPETSPGVQKLQTGTRCSFCGRTFRYKKSLDNHVSKVHSISSHIEQADEVVLETTSPLPGTRTSGRNRRNLMKQETRNDFGMESNVQQATADEEATSVEEEEEEVEEDKGGCGGDHNHDQEQGEQINKSIEETGAPAEQEVSIRIREDEECRKAGEVDGDDGEALGPSVGQETDLNSSHVAKAQGSAEQVKVRVYPEGLAPVIIQSSSKKTLKCPKCDKTFDRIGEKSIRWKHTDECM